MKHRTSASVGPLGMLMACVSAVTLLALAAAAEAQTNTVSRIISLAPDPASDLVLESLDLRIHEDGRRVLSGQTSVRDRTFFYVADPETGTYATFYIGKGGPSQNPKLVRYMQRYAARLFAEYQQQRGRQNGPEPVSADPTVARAIEDPCPCSELCSGAYTVTVTTYDPVYVPLTKTKLYSYWTRRTNYNHEFDECSWYKYASQECWAANPSSLGTHWYKQACPLFGPTGSNGYSDALAEGHYINWDFGSNVDTTNVKQTVRILLKPVTGVNWTYLHQDWGEASSLIFGSAGVSGSNTCF